jgi:hypothetical protein
VSETDDGSCPPAPKPSACWGLFFAYGLLFIAYGVYLAVLPSADPDHWRYYTRDPDVIAYLADDFRASGGLMVGFGALTMLTSVRWFRAGDRWAWYAYWIFPVLFAWNMATTWAVVLWLLLLLATVVALAISYRSFFPRTEP